jgi:hypothetical protein
VMRIRGIGSACCEDSLLHHSKKSQLSEKLCIQSWVPEMFFGSN